MSDLDQFDAYDPDPDDTSDYGSGRVFGTFMGMEISDDGAIDPDVKIKIDGEKQFGPLSRIRDHLGDEAFEKFLADMSVRFGEDASTNSAADAGSDSVSGVFDRQPVEFKCQTCNESFPRTMNDGDDRCPTCTEDH